MHIHHIALGARDVEAVAAFYGAFFDLDELRRHDDEAGLLRSIWLRLGEGVLMVEKTCEQRPAVEGVGAGPFLLAFAVDATKREVLEARLSEAGHPVEARTQYTSYIRDPEGNRVAFSHYPLTEPQRG